jgi:hypothetical protein
VSRRNVAAEEQRVLDLAMRLVGAVHDHDHNAVQQVMAAVGSPVELRQVTTVLAGMVPAEEPYRQAVDRGTSALLILGTPLCDPDLWGPPSRSAHGTHARYVAGCRGELCILAERAYQRAYKAKRRATGLAS